MRGVTLGKIAGAVLLALLTLLVMTTVATPAAAQEANDTVTIGQQISLVARDDGQSVRDHVQDLAFSISLNRSGDKAQVAQQRVQELHGSIMEAQEERQRLVEQLREGEISPGEFAVQIAEANREIARAAQSMERVENETERAGLDVNATEGLDESLRNAVEALRNRAAADVSVLDTAFQAHELARKARSGNFTGPEIAEFARGLGLNESRIGAPEGVPGGPPGGSGAPGNRTDGTERPDEPGNVTRGGATDGAAGRP
ncbi:MAG: hypothetical protein MAG715_01346 [Methanonatronarchaeales archaeon]|nr:hypothetical protein [Methanonatronarchaeales archaeon]